MTTEEPAAARPLVYAHRGASAAFAEHTRAAYLQAIADGADGVECDIHLTRDQHAVLLHDANLDRTSDGTGPVADRTLEELRLLDFCSWKGARIPEEYGALSEQFLTLPELLDILRLAGREIGLAIELKHPSPYQLKLEDRVLAVLEAEGWDPTTSMLDNIRVSFMSFSPDSVKHLLQSVPASAICQLVDDVHVEEIREELGLGALTGGALSYVRGHARTVRRWLDSGRRFRVWTVDSSDDVDLCRELGIQEITTNRPAEVRAQLLAPL